MLYNVLLEEQSRPASANLPEKSTLNYVTADDNSIKWQVCEMYADVYLEREILERERPQINSQITAYNVLFEYFKKDIETREIFVVAFLDAGNRVNLIKKMFSGSINAAIADVRLIVSTAVLTLSSSVIIAHNHPSGETRASTADINLTKKLKEALAFFDIRLLEHIIMTRHDYLAFTAEGLL